MARDTTTSELGSEGGNGLLFFKKNDPNLPFFLDFQIAGSLVILRASWTAGTGNEFSGRVFEFCFVFSIKNILGFVFFTW